MIYSVADIGAYIKDIAEESKRLGEEREKPTAQERLEQSRWDDWVIKVYFKREVDGKEQYGVTFMARGRKYKMESLFERFKDICDPQGEIWIELSTAIGPVHGCRGNIKAIRKNLGRLVPVDVPGANGWRDDLETVPMEAKRARFGRG